MSQCDLILEHLKQGHTLTPAIAYEKFGTLAMHSRAAELRERGHKIDCELIQVSNGKRVGCYRLAE